MNHEHAETEPLVWGQAPDQATLGDEFNTINAEEAPFQAAGGEDSFVPKQRYRPAKSTKILACAVLVMAGLFGGALVQKAVAPGQSGNRSNFSQLRTGSQGGETQNGGQGNTSTPTRGSRGGQGTGAGAGTAGSGTGAAAGGTGTTSP